MAEITNLQMIVAIRILSYANITPADLVYPAIAQAATDVLTGRGGLRMREAAALVQAIRDTERTP